MFASHKLFVVRSCLSSAILVLLVAASVSGQDRLLGATRRRAADPPATKKTAVPDADSQEKANKLLRELYQDKIDGATSADAKKRVARELFDKAMEMLNDPPSCYAMLRTAGTLAFKARDYELSLEIIDALDKCFEVDALKMRVKVLSSENSDTQVAPAARCSLGLELMEAAYANRRLDLAAKLGDLSEKAAEETKEPLLVKIVRGRRVQMESAIRAESAEKELIAKHIASRDDPEVNLALGKLYCFDRADWKKGAPMLAHGSDAALKQAAEKELAKPADGDGQMELGDTWWQLAQNADRNKVALLDRAQFWYRSALSNLTGLSKVKVEKRLAEIDAPARFTEGGGDRISELSGYMRRAPGLRPMVLAANGGSMETEHAVNAALVWLAKHQNYSEGNWSLQNYTSNCKPGDKSCTGVGDVPGCDCGATAMGLLPFLAAGHTHKSKNPFKEHVARGISWLLRNQQPDGDLAKGAHQMMYSHGLATIALSEAYGLSGDKQVGQAAQRAVDFIVHAQNKTDGGWRYNPGDAGDTSVVGWQLMALKSAHMAGLHFSGVVFQRTSKWLDSVAVHEGTEYSYQPGVQAMPPMTAVGLLCRQYLGANRDNPMFVGGVDYLMRNLPDASQRNVYYWYYATQVMHNMNNSDWKAWNEKMRELLVTTQCRDENCAGGSWDPASDAWGRHGGRLMQNALSALTLEIYYRYPPLYDSGDTGLQNAGSKGKAVDATTDQGVAKPPAKKTPRRRQY